VACISELWGVARKNQSSRESESEKSNQERENPFSVLISFVFLLILVFAFKQSMLDANNIPSGSMIPTLKVGDYLFVNKMRYSLRLPYLGTELLRIDDPKRGDIITFIPREETEKNYVKRVIGLPGDRIRIRYIGVCDPDLPLERASNPEYTCSSEYQDGAYQGPDVAFVEYKPNDSGEWQHFTYKELGPDESRTILTDSDSSSVLHPEIVPGYQSDVPVVFEETIEGRKHLIVERFRGITLDHGSICPTFRTTGCVLGEDKYFVMGDNRDDSKDSRYHEVGLIDRGSIQGKALIIYFSIDWRDQICHDYSMSMNGADMGIDGFRLEDFPVEDQIEYCSTMDQYIVRENIWQYLVRTALYRIPRMDVRWSRLGDLLH
tara:strand:- start:79603 stop:80733 length:1131 start_codon:yes stop_codon:yes gene_type:complete